MVIQFLFFLFIPILHQLEIPVSEVTLLVHGIQIKLHQFHYSPNQKQYKFDFRIQTLIKHYLQFAFHFLLN
jgi:hypothetical protein